MNTNPSSLRALKNANVEDSPVTKRHSKMQYFAQTLKSPRPELPAAAADGGGGGGGGGASAVGDVAEDTLLIERPETNLNVTCIHS